MDYITSSASAAAAPETTSSEGLLLTTNSSSNPINRDPFEQRVVYIEPRPSTRRRTSNNSSSSASSRSRQNPFLLQPPQRTYPHEEQWHQRLSYEARLAHQFEWQEDEEFRQLLTVSDDTTFFTPEDFLLNWNQQLQNEQQREIQRRDAALASSSRIVSEGAAAGDANSVELAETEDELPPPPYESLQLVETTSSDQDLTPLPAAAAERDPFAQRIIYFEPQPRRRSMNNSNSSSSSSHRTRHNLHHRHGGGSSGDGPISASTANVDAAELPLAPPPSYESLFGTRL